MNDCGMVPVAPIITGITFDFTTTTTNKNNNNKFHNNWNQYFG